MNAANSEFASGMKHRSTFVQEEALMNQPGTENSVLTIGRGDGELLGDDEVGDEHEDEPGGEAGVEVALRPALEPPPGLRLAAHLPLTLSARVSQTYSSAETTENAHCLSESFKVFGELRRESHELCLFLLPSSSTILCLHGRREIEREEGWKARCCGVLVGFVVKVASFRAFCS